MKAFTSAKRERRPVLVYARADWVTACLELERRTFPSPQVQRAAQRFVALRLDATNEEDPTVKFALNELEVEGLPTILLFDPVTERRVVLDRFGSADELAMRLDGFLDSP